MKSLHYIIIHKRSEAMIIENLLFLLLGGSTLPIKSKVKNSEHSAQKLYARTHTHIVVQKKS